MVCFARKYLVQLKIMSAIVENIKVYDTEVLFVIVAELKFSKKVRRKNGAHYIGCSGSSYLVFAFYP